MMILRPLKVQFRGLMARISTEAPSKFKWLWSVHLHLVVIQVAEEAEEVVIEEEEALGVEAVVEEEETAEMANNQIFKEDQETGGVKSIHVAIPISLGATSVTSAMLLSQMELAEAVEVVMVVDVVVVEEVLEAEVEEIVIVVDVAEDLEEAEVLEEVGTEEVVAQ